MERESLVGIRTMRDLRIQPSGRGRLKTSASIFRTEKARESLRATKDESRQAELNSALEKERKRFEKQDKAVGISQKKLLYSRKKLANLVDKNQKIMDFRREFQEKRWQRERDPVKKEHSAAKKFNAVKIEY